jgi:hypothetical protein
MEVIKPLEESIEETRDVFMQKKFAEFAQKVSREIEARMCLSGLKTSKKNKKRMMRHMMEKLYSKEPEKFWVDDVEEKR